MSCKSFASVEAEAVFDGWRESLAEMRNLKVCDAGEAKAILARTDTLLLNALSAEYEHCTASHGVRELPASHRGDCAVHCAHAG